MTSFPAQKPDPKSAAPFAAPAGLAQLGGRLQRMADDPAVRRALPAMITVAVVAVLVGAWMIFHQAPRATLFPQIDEAGKARVVEALSAAGIDVRVDPGAGAVTVPADDYHRARMALASQGLPAAAPDGNQVLSALPVGASRALETTRLRQAQELDLARTIAEIEGVDGARVHLALPERTAFLRENNAARASVFVALSPGRMLADREVEAVVRLVAASVPGLSPQDVTVVDQTGRLLSRNDDDPQSGLSDRQLRHRVEMETLLRRRIEAVLTPIVGMGNLSVEVTADVDFTVTEQTEERVDPEGNTLRSEQTTTSESRDAPAGGIPGALANTPPAAATLTDTPPAAGTPAPAQTRTAGIVRNFEVSRTVTRTRPETGGIRRVSAAIAVRGNAVEGAVADAAGAAVTPELLQNLQRLAETAIGFDAARGDSVTVIAQPFAAAMAPAEMPTDLSWVPGTVRELGLLVVLLVVGLGVLRPLLLRQLRSADAKPSLRRGGTVEVAEGETLDDVEARLDRRHKELAASVVGARAGRAEKQTVLRQLAADDPARVAAVLQRMLKSDAPTPL